MGCVAVTVEVGVFLLHPESDPDRQTIAKMAVVITTTADLFNFR
jgi:hypothetical protein